MSELLDRLANGPCLLLDGGLGSMLIQSGLPAGTPPEEWVLSEPDKIASVHKAYVDAGSDAVHACTFGANPARLMRYGLEQKCDEINAAAVGLARRSGARFVFCDIGPTGEYLPPVGTAEIENWRAIFERQVRSLVAAGCEAFHIETMSDAREALTALEAVKAIVPDIPVMVSITFEHRKRGFFTTFGNRLADSLHLMAERGASAVGANCSLTSTEMLQLASESVSAIDAPLVMQPNAGQPQVTAEGVLYGQPPERFAADMLVMARRGVAAVGGCCGTDPRFIAELRRLLDSATVTG